MRIARALTIATVALLGAGCSTADATTPGTPPNPDFICTLSHPSTTVTSLKRMPAGIRAYIKDKAGAMADRGQFFNAGDVVTRPAPFNRFIRGGKIAGDHWYLWYEHGGFAYWRQIVLFKSTRTDPAHVNAEKHGGPDLCADTDALLDAAVKVGL